MGVGADNVLDRMAASVGELTAVEPVFQAVSDVPNGGVLFALPALLAIGLLHQAHKYFQLPKGYYGLKFPGNFPPGSDDASIALDPH